VNFDNLLVSEYVHNKIIHFWSDLKMFKFGFEISTAILFVLFIKCFSGLKFFKMLNLFHFIICVLLSIWFNFKKVVEHFVYKY